MPVGHSPVFSRRNSTPLHTPAVHRPENDKDRRTPNTLPKVTDEENQRDVDLDLNLDLSTKNGSVKSGGVGVGGLEANGDNKKSTEISSTQGMDQAASKVVGKLDDSVYKPFGQGSQSGSISSLSRSSSDTGSEGAVCSGGPHKKVCGNPVKEGEAGVLCDRCLEWFHAT